MTFDFSPNENGTCEQTIYDRRDAAGQPDRAGSVDAV
ncbi:MAG: hypothetical protein RL376_648 [Verrucomicrobiota bacterium]